MSRVLVYSNNPVLSKELQTAACEIAAADDVCVLRIVDGVNGADIAGANLYEITQDASVSDVAATAQSVVAAADSLAADVILLSSDRRGKELAGRIGQKIGCGIVTNATSIKLEGDTLRATKNALGGAIVEEVEIATERKVVAVSPKCYEPAQTENGTATKLEVSSPEGSVALTNTQAKEQGSTDIASADVLFVVGVGFEEREDASKVDALADRLGAGVACTKPVATDRKWYEEDRIVGISGKTCKPSLAILLGISGQVQFWAGIRDAKVVAAVNSDENAAIMDMVDYSLVGDVEEVVPKLAELL